jgi:hypothetical protein
VSVIYHTDGAVMEVVKGPIDMGIDVLQALQFSAVGMDPQEVLPGPQVTRPFLLLLCHCWPTPGGERITLSIA